MSKHIKLEDAINKMDEWFCEPYTPTELLSDLPTIDIVHCKDCRSYEPLDSSRPFYCPKGIWKVNADDFCSYGERKDNE